MHKKTHDKNTLQQLAKETRSTTTDDIAENEIGRSRGQTKKSS